MQKCTHAEAQAAAMAAELIREEEEVTRRAGWKHNSHMQCLQNATKGKKKKKKKGKLKTYEERAIGEEKPAVEVEQAARGNTTATQATLLVVRTEEADAALQAATTSEDLESIVSTPDMELQVSF